MHEDEMTLCQRILAKCQQQRWYAGDEQNTALFRLGGFRYEEFVDPQGNLTVIDNNPDDHPHKIGFAYPPATETQLRETEQVLGFSLPPHLRQTYSSLANGGFGPGYGLISALGGFDEAGNLVDTYQYHARRAELIDLPGNLVPHQDENSSGQSLELPDTIWPRFLLYLCDWGEAKVSCLDCASGAIFLVDLGQKRHAYVLEFQVSTLHEWWEQWLEKQPVSMPDQEDEQESARFLDDFDSFLTEEDI